VRNAVLIVILTMAAAALAQAGGRFETAPEAAPSPVPRATVAFRMPVCAAAGAAFGEIADPLNGKPAFHSGLDFPAPYGTPVQAVAAGRVTAAERMGPYGLFVEIDHGQGIKSRYGQLQTATVHAGDSVTAGQTIATVGSSGRSTGPHLHFEVAHDGLAYDPRLFLNGDTTCAGKPLGQANAAHRMRVVDRAPDPSFAAADEATQFAWPLCGPASSGFGYRTDPYTKKWAFHAGIDLIAPVGTPVRAGATGRVIAAELRGPYGNLVEIDHGAGLRTRYAQLAKYVVGPGDLVQRGQIVGQVGSTGRATGPHLHFEIWIKDIVRDPRKHLEPEQTCAVP
jgi:murein DD-endopeptidase MepM/ murein hydrolase activator NlpD